MDLIDLHSHLLPGVDDGSATAAQSAEVAEQFWNDGVREICLTPHVSLSETVGAARAEMLARFAGGNTIRRVWNRFSLTWN